MPRSAIGVALVALALAIPAVSTAGSRHSSGGGKVSHKGWPAINGMFWKATDGGGHSKTGTPRNDELLGHGGSDHISGGAGSDVIWGDWDPVVNGAGQHDVLSGGAGNDWIYTSHGTNTVYGGPGNDYVYAYYGRGFIDCGSGHDTVRIRLGGAYTTRNCEVVNHFCAHGSDGHGGCLKPGEAKKASRRRG